MLDRFCWIVGVGKIYSQGPNGKWQWRVGAQEDVLKVLGLLWPELGEVKRGQAMRALSRRGLELLIPAF